jgi:hypothetical protein
MIVDILRMNLSKMKEMNATLFAEIEEKRNELSELILHFESLAKEEINLPYKELVKEQSEVEAQIKAIED